VGLTAAEFESYFAIIQECWKLCKLIFSVKLVQFSMFFLIFYVFSVNFFLCFRFLTVLFILNVPFPIDSN
jgi:hypothetical protein